MTDTELLIFAAIVIGGIVLIEAVLLLWGSRIAFKRQQQRIERERERVAHFGCDCSVCRETTRDFGTIPANLTE